ncbi:hypothetical protein FKM82_012614 [Ascaphus truei]
MLLHLEEHFFAFSHIYIWQSALHVFSTLQNKVMAPLERRIFFFIERGVFENVTPLFLIRKALGFINKITFPLTLDYFLQQMWSKHLGTPFSNQ